MAQLVYTMWCKKWCKSGVQLSASNRQHYIFNQGKITIRKIPVKYRFLPDGVLSIEYMYQQVVSKSNA